MKKFLSIALALTMCLSLSIPAFADSSGEAQPYTATEKCSEFKLGDSGKVILLPTDYTKVEPQNEMYDIPAHLSVADGELGLGIIWYDHYSEEPLGEVGLAAMIQEFGAAAISEGIYAGGNWDSPEGIRYVSYVIYYGIDDYVNVNYHCPVAQCTYYFSKYSIDTIAANIKQSDSEVPAQPASPSFSDVKATDYFAESVAWAVERNITNGTSQTTFSPEKTCTQGEILTFLWRAKGEPAPAASVSDTAYYAKAAQWAKEQGLTDNFSADADCTRAMVVTYLWKLAGSPAVGSATFADVPADAPYAQAVAWAVAQGVTNGTGNGSFSPNATCTRGQIVTFLFRALAK